MDYEKRREFTSGVRGPNEICGKGMNVEEKKKKIIKIQLRNFFSFIFI